MWRLSTLCLAVSISSAICSTGAAQSITFGAWSVEAGISGFAPDFHDSHSGIGIPNGSIIHDLTGQPSASVASVATWSDSGSTLHMIAKGVRSSGVGVSAHTIVHFTVMEPVVLQLSAFPGEVPPPITGPAGFDYQFFQFGMHTMPVGDYVFDGDSSVPNGVFPHWWELTMSFSVPEPAIGAVLVVGAAFRLTRRRRARCAAISMGAPRD